AEKPSRPPILGVAARLQRLGSPQNWGAGGVARLLLAAFAIGSLYALNSWDLPTYAVIYLFALALPEFFRGRVGARRWVAGGAFVALAVLLFVPYYLHFTSLVGGQPFDLPEPWRSLPLVSRLSRTLGIVIWGKTPPDQFFTVYLLPYVVGLLFLVWLWRRVGGGPAPSGVLGKGGWTVPALVVLGLALGATLLQMPVLFLAGVLVALTLAILSRAAARDADTFAAVLIGSAFALVLVTEVFFIHDIFGNRMNTVFKVYYQAWTLLAVGGGYALARTIFDWRRAPAARLWRVPAAGAAALLLLASLAYPLASSWSRTNHLQGQSGLDGLAYVKTALPNEYAGIEWVRSHVPAGAVVAEAPGCSYGELDGVPHDRVSAFAGVETPIGWAGHEQQWRGGAPDLLAQIAPRQADVNTLYSTTDVAQAERILDRYHIEYVYVGVFERNGYSAGGIGADCKVGPPYPAAGLAKFDTMMTKVFSQGNVAIYARR
ncbi:MAG TPA: DUF2298 domain-containing protein, partial [Thermomicrobiales bacterium]|nr:DUF2298 domain-containing protein [Thermomicrobiales bacterium]